MNIKITREGVLGTILGAALMFIYQYPAAGTVLYLEKDGVISKRAVFNNQVDCRLIRDAVNKVRKSDKLHCKGTLYAGEGES